MGREHRTRAPRSHNERHKFGDMTRLVSRYDYYPCANCGQEVAHTKGGRVLHMHARSRKCQRRSRRP